MAITAKDVMALRQRTGLGMMECKQALTEADGDMDAAIELLRERLKGKMDERTDRATAEGLIAIARGPTAVAMVSLQAETDFVARNESFAEAADRLAQMALETDIDGSIEPTAEMQQIVEDLRLTIRENISIGGAHRFVGDRIGDYLHHNRKVGVLVKASGDVSDELLTGIAQHIAAAVPQPLAIDKSGLPQDEVDSQRNQAIQEAQESGKPAEIAEKIAAGKLNKWIEENTLLGQTYLRELDAKKPVGDYLPKGAKIEDFVRYRLAA